MVRFAIIIPTRRRRRRRRHRTAISTRTPAIWRSSATRHKHVVYLRTCTLAFAHASVAYHRPTAVRSSSNRKSSNGKAACDRASATPTIFACIARAPFGAVRPSREHCFTNCSALFPGKPHIRKSCAHMWPICDGGSVIVCKVRALCFALHDRAFVCVICERANEQKAAATCARSLARVVVFLIQG